jgi:hypothetical protein
MLHNTNNGIVTIPQRLRRGSHVHILNLAGSSREAEGPAL